MKALKNDIEKMVGKNPPFLDIVLNNFEKESLKRNEFLFKEGDICRSIYFIESGLLQVLQIDKNGFEKTTDLIIKDNWFTDIDSFKNRAPSQLNVKAKKATVVSKISGDSFKTLMENVPKFAEAYLKIIEEKYNESMQRIAAFNTLNAQEKIEWLHKFKPNFLIHISDKLIASYLGISKETYCRLK